MQVASELQKRCGSRVEATTTVEMKQQKSAMLDCMRKKLNADLDAVLLPLKKSEPAKFKALMSEQATWNRALDPSCDAQEELAWLDFDEGTRYDGTGRNEAWMACLDRALTERVLYTRLLAAADPAGLATRIHRVQAQGTQVKSYLLERQGLAAKWVMVPPKATPTEGVPADWKAFYGEVASIQKNTTDLAHSTCSSWPELAKELGGTASCEKKVELYYYVQGNEKTDPVEH